MEENPPLPMLDFHSRQGYIHPFPSRPRSLTSPLYGNLCPALPARLLITPSECPQNARDQHRPCRIHRVQKNSWVKWKKCRRRCAMLGDDHGRVWFTHACLSNASLSSRLCCALLFNRKPECISSQTSLLTLYSTKKQKTTTSTEIKRWRDQTSDGMWCKHLLCTFHLKMRIRC